MKTTTFKMLWLCFIAIALVACSKKEDCDPEDENSLCYAGLPAGSNLLLLEEKANGRTEMRFEYNDQNNVVVRYVHGVDGSMTIENFTYNGDKLTKVERRSDGRLVMSEEYFYNVGNRPSTGLQKNNKGEIENNIVYNYLGDRVTETFFNREGEQVGVNTYIFDSTGKNIIKQVSNIHNMNLFTLEYADYDDKPCRYTNYPWAWKVGSVNNAQFYSLTTNGVGDANSTKNDVWKYTYNNAGYPTKAEVYEKGSGTLLETRTFTYKRAN
ncbi:hypothetical protein [Sphingobacterium faecale]|uniref:YD repeat-containing protein n=1 Tax=Sphingobacterium faecale TaxID=2803775 RepID=A0ABS1QYV8_9SPHI|nr:hypothetical protein [Sphingobacterium faecale]MBL1407618.1 hypothetical protein [Sphingobacterium faecale]